MGLCRREIQAELELLVAWWHEFKSTPVEDRDGVVCSFVSAAGELLMPTFYAGNVSLADAFACGFFHFEKGARLLDNKGHWTSAKSADPNSRQLPFHLRKWPGSIRCNNRPMLVLISGLPWQGDQSIAAVFASRHGALSLSGLAGIADESSDTTCIEFAQFCEERSGESASAPKIPAIPA